MRVILAIDTPCALLSSGNRTRANVGKHKTGKELFYLPPLSFFFLIQTLVCLLQLDNLEIQGFNKNFLHLETTIIY